MSHAIFDLHLEMPPVSVIRVRRNGVAHWIARCETCGQRGQARKLLSATLRDGYNHGRKHATQMLHKAAHHGAVA